MNPRIKICGITSVPDALAAVDCGADYIGLIFVENSPRYVDAAQARQIILAVEGKVPVVGVFQNQELDTVNTLVEQLGLNMVQFHGQESPVDCRSCQVPVIKSFDLVAEFNPVHVYAYAESVQYLLFDRTKNLDCKAWLDMALDKVSGMTELPRPFFLAGGLAKVNLPTVKAKVKPYALDLCSSIEAQPGRKDHMKMAEFCLKARGATESNTQLAGQGVK